MAFGRLKVDELETSTQVVDIDALVSNGVSDGDKGDITVSSSGTVWSIDDGAVDTAALGGDITIAGKALLDDADAAAQRTTLGAEAAGTAASAISTHEAAADPHPGYALESSLATVATTGAYADLTGTPALVANLDDLGDVDLTTTPPADGEALVYDSVAGEWVPGAAAAQLGDLNDVVVTTPSDKQVLEYDSATSQWVNATPSGGVVYYNRRPALHRGSLFYKTAATTISITAGAVLNGQVYSSATAVTMPGSFTNNTDYAIWQHPSDGTLVADASFTTAPSGATGGSIVGGFHYIPSGRPTAFNNGSPTTAAEILEYSIWDLTYRPSCPDPRGMACIEAGFWIDLYLAGATSYAGATFSAVPSSKIGLTIADGSSPPLVPAQYGGDGSTNYGSFTWYEASEMARSFGKALPTYDQFSAAAYGAPEASSRGSDPGTVQWERVSLFGLAQATGTIYQWAQETCTSDPPSGWQSGVTDGRGSVYGSQTRALRLGGVWADSFYSGSRCGLWTDTPWTSASNRGARFVAGHLVLS